MKPLFTWILSVILIGYAFSAKAQGSWPPLASNIVDATSASTIYSVIKDSSGNIYAGMLSGVYKWNGNSWILLGTPNTLYAPYSLTTDSHNNIYATGNFTDPQGNYYVAKWDGANWTELGVGNTALSAAGPIRSITTDQAGNIYAAGEFTDGLSQHYVAKWDGAHWTEVGTGTNALNANGTIWSVVADAAGNLYAAGNFTDAGGHPYVAKWNGSAWTELGGSGSSFSTYILCLTLDQSGNVYAGGEFVNAGGYNYVAEWNGSTWAEVGAGANALNAANWIRCLTVDHEGNLYAGGEFYQNVSKYVAKWNGSTWTTVGTGTNSLNANGGIYSIVADTVGNLYIGGAFTNSSGNEVVEEWNNSAGQWAVLSSGGVGVLDIGNGSGPTIIAADTAGSVYVAGAFVDAAGNRYVAKWSNNRWSSLIGNPANAPSQVSSLKADRSGHLYVLGYFPFIGNAVARWADTSWVQLVGGPVNPNGQIDIIGLDSAGNLYASGTFTDPAGNYYVAKWNGSAWSEIGGDGTLLQVGQLGVDLHGNVFVGVANQDSTSILRWTGSKWVSLSDANTNGNYDLGLYYISIDKYGNVYTRAEAEDSYGFHDFVAEWKGDYWHALGGADGVLAGSVYAAPDPSGTMYLQSDNYVFRCDGTNLTPLHPFASNRDYASQFAFDLRGNLYGVGQFTGSNGIYYEARYDSTYLPAPSVSGIAGHCQLDSTATAKINNLPSYATVAITEDGAPLAYSTADSTFIYFTTRSTPVGSHSIHVSYAFAGNAAATDTGFVVTAAFTPAITIAGNIKIVYGGSTVLTATINSPVENTSLLQWQDSTSTQSWTSVAGATAVSLTYTPLNGSKIRCQLVDTAACATQDTVYSNILSFAVQPAPDTTAVPNGIKIYPDPAKDMVTLTNLALTDQWQSLDIYNLQGRLVIANINVSDDTQITINISALAPGYYVCRLTGVKGQAYVKFLKF